MKKYIAWTEHDEEEWVRPINKDYKLGCCDCDLVHTVNFRLINKEGKVIPVSKIGHLEIKMVRDNRSTGQCRRWSKKKVS